MGHQWYAEDSYVLACQPQQVFYINDPKLGLNLKVVQKSHQKHLWDVSKEIMEDDDS